MKNPKTFTLFVFLIVLWTIDASELHLRMQNAHPLKDDTYLCRQFDLNNEELYITEFDPFAAANTAHHMLLYACEEPGSQTKDDWDCSEMNGKQTEPVCKGTPKIIYAWAMNAKKLVLPKGVSFKVGTGKSRYLVLQIHYKSVATIKNTDGEGDSSGMILKVTKKKTDKIAGIYLMGTGGYLDENAITYMETACEYDLKPTLKAFAFRVHAHKHGVVSSGYRFRKSTWKEIGRMNPQKEEMFYNVTGNRHISIRQGDILAARCTMDNRGNKDRVYIGMGQNDEMCNFYIMYYTDSKDMNAIQETNCWSGGNPDNSWRKYGLTGEPALASTEPDSNQLYESTKN